MKRAAIYLRVSSLGQVGRAVSAEGYSIELQRESCQRRARERELEVVAEYVDYGQSARAANRPRFQELLTRVRERGDIEALIVFNVSRFARNMHDEVVIGLELERLGVEVISATEHFDHSPLGKRMRRYLAADAEFYSEELAVKAKAACTRGPGMAARRVRAPLATSTSASASKGLTSRSSSPIQTAHPT